MTADFSSYGLGANGKWHNIFQVLKEKNCQPRILYTVEIVRSEGKLRHSQKNEK